MEIILKVTTEVQLDPNVVAGELKEAIAAGLDVPYEDFTIEVQAAA